ncbi:MAG: PQQ-dependent dehydrogenase, methanol/ethanol family [Gammaproteobacteria bacterium]
MKIRTVARHCARVAVSLGVACALWAAAASAKDDAANQWPSVGRTSEEQRFSPLAQINSGNVNKLGLAWYADFDTNRGQEATPLFIDGVLYLSTAWSKVKAYDARTGKLLWAFDPKVPGEFAGRGCCDVVNRGVAAWDGKIYVATYDGRLIAIDQKTGKEVWSVLTLDHDKPVTSTGAPRIAKGKVIIGNAGGEFGVRGYITAYDGKTGKQLWRFYTVPGDPAEAVEQPIMKVAAKTWSGNWWDLGGGGTVWDGLIYDEKNNLVMLGTGNGSPWNRKYRGDGGGDNLFIASIVAVNADTGKYAWHYQQAPGEGWDYDATSPLMLADLKIDGKPRHVLMQASKNGYFYVLDAKNGKFISANNFVTGELDEKGFDPNTGRPNVNPEVRYDETGRAAMLQPGGQGAHGWHPMSFSPQTGLTYFSAWKRWGAMKGGADLQSRTDGPPTTGLSAGAAAELKTPMPNGRRALATRGVGSGEAEGSLAHRRAGNDRRGHSRDGGRRGCSRARRRAVSSPIARRMAKSSGRWKHKTGVVAAASSI